MRWSLNTYQTCQDWELGKILKIAEDTGYHGVELLMDYKQKHGFEWDTPEDQWSRLKDEVVDKLPKFPFAGCRGSCRKCAPRQARYRDDGLHGL